MKNVADSRIMKRSLGVLGLVAGAGLAAGLMAFADYNRQIEVNEHSAELTQLMVEAAHSNQLIRELNGADPEQAKAQLKSSLAYSLKAIKGLAPEADRKSQDAAAAMLAEIVRQQNLHPDYYLASNRKTGFEKADVLQVVQH